MNWDAIGAIGEIDGAIAVVATLFYLAAQIRHGVKIAESDAFERVFPVSTYETGCGQKLTE